MLWQKFDCVLPVLSYLAIVSFNIQEQRQCFAKSGAPSTMSLSPTRLPIPEWSGILDSARFNHYALQPPAEDVSNDHNDVRSTVKLVEAIFSEFTSKCLRAIYSARLNNGSFDFITWLWGASRSGSLSGYLLQARRYLLFQPTTT